jgi:hypothetical protein
MSISEIQKRKFLENLYRSFYSTGLNESDTALRQPNDDEIKKEFDNYFSTNRIGVPLRVDPSLLRNTPITSPEIMNNFMARYILNLDVLYDSIDDNTEKLMDSVSYLNKKIDFLKQKRIDLEKKIDSILFSISNTDGFFYSFSESFANLNNVDLSLTNAFVDTENKKTTLPKLKSNVLDFNAPGKVNYSNVQYRIMFNGNIASTDRQMPDVNNMFDGLNNTMSKVEFSSDIIGPCALIMNIPLDAPFVISKVDGKLSTGSAVTTVVELINQQNLNSSQFRRKQSNSDYDRFSFDFDPQLSGSLRITLIKHEPDYVDQLNTKNKYKYTFCIRDLIVSGQYYDANATLISSPISIPAGDANKIIDAVSIEAVNENQNVGNINFFIAEDVQGASGISDFNWIPISSSTENSAAFDQIISFSRSNKVFKNIKSNPSTNDLKLYDESTENNLSVKNPSTSIYNGISVRRVAKLNEQDSPYNSYLLDSVNCFSFKYTSYLNGLYLDTNRWSSIINKTLENVQVFEPGNIQITNIPSIPIALNLSGISGFLQTSLLVEEDIEAINIISKSDTSVAWDMAVYLNGTLLADMPAGVSTKEVSWSFKKGVNNIVVTFDASGTSSGSISLMSGVSISTYGVPFIKYYSYVDPFDFRINRTENDTVFTIDNYLGNNEILCRSKVNDNSRIVFQKNSNNPVSAIRFRADFSRFSSPFGTPSLGSYRIKFKNSN